VNIVCLAALASVWRAAGKRNASGSVHISVRLQPIASHAHNDSLGLSSPWEWHILSSLSVEPSVEISVVTVKSSALDELFSLLFLHKGPLSQPLTSFHSASS